MAQQRHMVKKQILDLHVGSNIPAFDLQNQLSALYRNKITPLIEAYCNQLSHPDVIQRIDILEIELGEIDIQNLEQEFVEKVMTQLGRQLAEKLGASTSTPLTTNIQRLGDGASPETQRYRQRGNAAAIPAAPTDRIPPLPRDFQILSQKREYLWRSPAASPLNPSKSSAKLATKFSFTASHLELVGYFIQTGLLPWWRQPLGQQALEDCVEQLLRAAPIPLKTLLQTQLQFTNSLQRLIYQFSDRILIEMATLLAPTASAWLPSYIPDIQALLPQVESWRGITPRQFRLKLWQGILGQFASSLPLNADSCIRASLFHLATSFQVNVRSLLPQMLRAVEHLQNGGFHFTSELLAILTASPQIQTPQTSHDLTVAPRLWLEVENLIRLLGALLGGLDNLEDEHPILLSRRIQIDRLLGQLNFLLRNAPSTPSESPSLTLLAHLVAEIASLVSEFEGGETPPAYLPITSQIKEIALSIKPSVRLPASPFPPEPFNACVSSFGEAEEIYLHNAGLILLWPFLNRFFESLSLVQANQFIHPQANQRAVLLLQYLVDAATAIPEHLLPLNKLLCGLDLLEPVEANLDITELEKDECDNLLMAVIGHWPTLKRTSPEGVRQAFLQRAGVLRPYRGNWLLQVERKPYDVLLDQLPWSIRVVKLPWRSEILHVEW